VEKVLGTRGVKKGDGTAAIVAEEGRLSSCFDGGVASLVLGRGRALGAPARQTGREML